jgi:hypothetical protein
MPFPLNESADLSGAAPLSEADRSLLAFESVPWKRTAKKEQAIRAELGLEPTDYYLRLQRLVRDPAALAEFPLLLSRLAERVERSATRYSLGAGEDDDA